MIAWWLISYYGERIFMKYETIIYSLCIISLFFWVWELVDFSSLNKIMTSYNLSGTEGRIFEKGTKSILVYTSFYNRAIYAIPRNSGFTWEPGPFSSYIVIALYINLARQNFQIINNKRFFVFLITLITTQSTTGLIGFLAIIIWTALNKYRNKYVILGLPISLCIVAYLFFTVPFLQQKIIEESQEDIEMAIRRSIKYNLDITPGRFAGMKLGLMDFKNHPITGYGGQPALRYAEQRGASVATVNGFAGILARYGIFGILIFLFFIFKTGIWLSNHFNFDYFWFFPLIVLIISFSFSIIESPLLFSLWFFAFFYHETFINEESVYGES